MFFLDLTWFLFDLLLCLLEVSLLCNMSEMVGRVVLERGLFPQ